MFNYKCSKQQNVALAYKIKVKFGAGMHIN